MQCQYGGYFQINILITSPSASFMQPIKFQRHPIFTAGKTDAGELRFTIGG